MQRGSLRQRPAGSQLLLILDLTLCSDHASDPRRRADRYVVPLRFVLLPARRRATPPSAICALLHLPPRSSLCRSHRLPAASGLLQLTPRPGPDPCARAPGAHARRAAREVLRAPDGAPGDSEGELGSAGLDAEWQTKLAKMWGIKLPDFK